MKRCNIIDSILQIDFQFFQQLRSKSGSVPAFLFGLVNGLLPCGMVYFALLNAITADNMQGASLSMFIFGLGTLPVMFFLTYLMQNVNKRFQSNLNRWLPYILTIAALLTILRGMNLGIPYLSPKVTMEQHELRKQPSLKCCETDLEEK
jgi:sulfite exporter TauE/SafE